MTTFEIYAVELPSGITAERAITILTQAKGFLREQYYLCHAIDLTYSSESEIASVQWIVRKAIAGLYTLTGYLIDEAGWSRETGIDELGAARYTLADKIIEQLKGL